MRVEDALRGVTRLGIDTSPFIYFIEANPNYFERTSEVFQRMSKGAFTGITSVITLTEALHKPLKQGDKLVEQAYRRMVRRSRQLTLVSVSLEIAEQAAHLRAGYNLRTPDALQIATALDQRCEAFLTNDFGLKRITQVRIIVLDELELQPSSDI